MMFCGCVLVCDWLPRSEAAAAAWLWWMCVVIVSVSAQFQSILLILSERADCTLRTWMQLFRILGAL